MILDNQLHCEHCERRTSKVTFKQRYVGPHVVRVAECIDKADCAMASKSKVGAR